MNEIYVDALAALASTAAFAQSVTLSGGVGVAMDKNVGARSNISQTDGWVNFAVTEDLGGGLKVAASQQLAFKGRSGNNGVQAEDTKTSIEGSFGKVEFNNVAAASNNLSSLASLATDVNGILGGDTNLNYLRYTAPTLVQGLTLQAGSYNKMSSGTLPVGDIGTKDVSTFFKGTYASGPATVAADYRTVDGRTRAWVSYDLGVAKAEWAGELAYTDSSKKKQNEIGLTVPMGAMTLGLHYGKKEGVGKGTEAAVVYALSKRTNINFSVANLKALDTRTIDGTATRVRLLHTF